MHSALYLPKPSAQLPPYLNPDEKPLFETYHIPRFRKIIHFINRGKGDFPTDAHWACL